MPCEPNGKTHRILRRLEQGSASFPELAEIAGLRRPWTDAQRKKLWRLITFLSTEGRIVQAHRRFVILPAGLDLLADLDGQAEREPGQVGATFYLSSKPGGGRSQEPFVAGREG